MVRSSRFELEKGQFFTDEQHRNAALAVVLGSAIASETFNGVEPVGQIIQIERVRFRVIGVMKEQGKGGGKLAIKRRDHDKDVYIPIKSSLERLEKWPIEDKDLYHEISSLWIEVKRGVDLLKARDIIMSILKRRHQDIDDLAAFYASQKAE